MLENIVIAAVICVLAFIIAYVYIPANNHRLVFALIIFTAVLIRFMTVFYIYRNGTSTFGTDGLLYHREGIDIANQLATGTRLTDIKYSYTLYTAFIGIIYHFAGVNRYLASYVNIVFAFASGLILLKIALNHKYSLPNSILISACFLYFPNLVLWTADTRKESLLILICFLCWLSVQRLLLTIDGKNFRGLNIIQVLFICILMWIGTLIRIYIFIPFSLGIVTSLVILYREKRQKICLAYAALIFTCGIIILVTVLYPMTGNYHAVSFPKEQKENIVDAVNSKVDTINDIIAKKNILKSIAYWLLLPNPAKMNISDISFSNKVQLVVRIDMIIWYICLFLILTGIYSAFKTRDSYFLGLLSFIAAYILINAVIAENVADTVYRYRSAIVGLTILFIDGKVIKQLFRQFGMLFYSNGEVKPTSYSKYEVLSLVQNRKNYL
ncbi:MAG: hypothetical protein FIA99_04765 [Ruminiclostridium sp.]|nr:hypothetical protein [Ruminiclostridium sp.]